MSSSSPSKTSDGWSLSRLSNGFKAEEDEYSFRDEWQLSTVRRTYARKPKTVDYWKVSVPKDVNNLCFMFDQLSVYHQNPPYPPCKFKLDPFSRSTPSPVHPTELHTSFNDGNGKETMLFQSPLKDPPKKLRHKDQLSKSANKKAPKLIPSIMRKS